MNVRKKTIGRLITITLIVVAGYYCVHEVATQWSSVAAILSDVSWSSFVVATVIATVGFSLSGVGLTFFYEGYSGDKTFSRPQLIGTYLVANIFRYVPGKILAPVYMVQVSGLRKVELTQAVFTMVVSSLAAGALCSVILASCVVDSGAAKAVLLTCLIACSVFLVPAVNNRVFSLFSKTLNRFMRGDIRQIPIGCMVRGVIVIFAGWLLAGVSLVVVVGAFTPMSLSQAALCSVVYPASFCAGFLVLTAPAGLGVREAVIIPVLSTIFTFAGNSESQFAIAISITILHRFIVTISDVLLCGVGAFLQPTKPKSVT